MNARSRLPLALLPSPPTDDAPAQFPYQRPTPAVPEREPTLAEILATWKKFHMIELQKAIDSASRTMALTIDMGELARHGGVIAAFEKLKQEPLPAASEGPEPDWNRLTPAEMHEYQAARAKLRTSPGDLDAGLVLLRLRAQALGAHTTITKEESESK